MMARISSQWSTMFCGSNVPSTSFSFSFMMPSASGPNFSSTHARLSGSKGLAFGVGSEAR